jgi:hypothetical protein
MRAGRSETVDRTIAAAANNYPLSQRVTVCNIKLFRVLTSDADSGLSKRSVPYHQDRITRPCQLQSGPAINIKMKFTARTPDPPPVLSKTQTTRPPLPTAVVRRLMEALCISWCYSRDPFFHPL